MFDWDEVPEELGPPNPAALALEAEAAENGWESGLLVSSFWRVVWGFPWQPGRWGAGSGSTSILFNISICRPSHFWPQVDRAAADAAARPETPAERAARRRSEREGPRGIAGVRCQSRKFSQEEGFGSHTRLGSSDLWPLNGSELNWCPQFCVHRKADLYS